MVLNTVWGLGIMKATLGKVNMNLNVSSQIKSLVNYGLPKKI